MMISPAVRSFIRRHRYGNTKTTMRFCATIPAKSKMIYPTIMAENLYSEVGCSKGKPFMSCYSIQQYPSLLSLPVQCRGCVSSSKEKTTNLVKSVNTGTGRQFVAAVKDTILKGEGAVERVAFDCEGVSLSRIGSIDLISIAFLSMGTFLVDVGRNRDPEIVIALKDLFENSKVTKIIHDCRKDGDALFHILGIKLNNVHDTSCFHHAINHEKERGLNDVLIFNGMHKNTVRDNSVYKTNPAFWATRPLTEMMIDWASSDVDKLFDLASKQLEGINHVTTATAIDQSNRWASLYCDMEVATDLRPNRRRLFVGWYGAEQRRKLEKRTGTKIYNNNDGTWYVYFHTRESLDSVKRVFAHTTKKSNNKKKRSNQGINKKHREHVEIDKSP